MSVPLSEHLPLIASAPDGIQKLRELILELAVRGKLVPQDPNDEPASELLMQISKERSQQEASGIYKKSKPLPRVTEDEHPFELPNGWSWGRIADAANPQAGFAFKSAAFNDAGVGMPLIRIRDVGFSAPTTFFDGPYREEFVVNDGDYLVSMDGQFRVAVWRGPQALLNQRVSRLQFYSDSLAKSYLAISLHIRLADLQGIKAYTTVDHLSGGQIASAVVGIPPLAEQHRIVAKVDELMALCDRLESEQNDSAAAHAQLVETLLGTLTQSTDAADFEANWQRIAEHFDTLFSTEASIDTLQKTILQLAVVGKLVPQDPNDEPAAHLLKKISEQTILQERNGQIKKVKTLPPPKLDECPFELPNGWEWRWAGNVTSQITDGTHHTPTYVSAGVPFLSVKDLSSGHMDFSNTRFITPDQHAELTKRCNPEHGDLLLTKVGTTGIAVLVNTKQPFSIFVSVALLKLPVKEIGSYLQLLVNSPFVKKQSDAGTEGVGNKNLVLRKISSFILPIPPLAEQQRIVAKVDELMAVCNQLKASIKAATSAQSTLSSALIQKALEAA